ncbi:succinate dehydrogenase membrane anchor subunit SDH4 NDAI_0A01150 [Naumovozyma dairenensis CBS 421]|uniref:Succinate dehydrogenase [ubiquinone] cytochrome b small subunit n=1 Tax=Naumovozyma dairenensis (strain ATCC 10597 / BCRC 20456 / CBS 421 / NBRC 0211 / NRRL Y-12639) TaxID=1071378 RepID=G0W385_NAUDC|nr:hypothetical protein NDAI_0A01150 [Naumovozyma dairenensis CBS 421]CCD22273.1 hypothetical protein NDAI_0A01150 [Naumovozyma dairenensis CBS 421]
MFVNPLKTISVQRSLQLSTSRCFQTSAKRCLTIPFLPVLPQKAGGVTGSPNDAYIPPKMNKFEGSYHWWLEKVFAVTSLPLVTVAAVTSGPLSTTCDSLLSVGLLGYCYMEFHSCITDYISKRVYGKYHNYALYLLGAGSVVSLFGIYKLETENNGITGLVKGWWKGELIEDVEAEKKKVTKK